MPTTRTNTIPAGTGGKRTAHPAGACAASQTASCCRPLSCRACSISSGHDATPWINVPPSPSTSETPSTASPAPAGTEPPPEWSPPESAAPPAPAVRVRRRLAQSERRHRPHQERIGVSPPGVYNWAADHRPRDHRPNAILQRHVNHLLSFWNLDIDRCALHTRETLYMDRFIIRFPQDAVAAGPSRHRASSLRTCPIKAWHRSAPSCREERRGQSYGSFVESFVRCRNRGLPQAPDTWP